MDRKILILGITLTVVILFLSFRKEGYEEELKEWQTQTETLQNETIEVDQSFDIDSFIDNVRSVQEKQENSDDALEAFFEAAGELGVLGTSSDDASEAYATNYRNQIQYTRLLIQISQEKNEERREELKEQLRETVQALHDGQAIASQGGEFSLDEISGFIPKRQIVKVNNVLSSGVDSEKVSYGPIVAQATGEPKHSTINQYRETVNVRVPKCEGNSCLTKDGEPGSPGYIIGSSDSGEAFGSCAVDCLNADKCSGFSVKEESTGAFYCKLTNNGFEKVQNESTVANEKLEQVYAIHEGFSENDWDSYLKNPLYFKMFNSAFDDNNCVDVPNVEECVGNGRNSKTKIENDGIPRDCEGEYISADLSQACPTTIPTGASNTKLCFNYNPNGESIDKQRPYYVSEFNQTGEEAINGGACPNKLSFAKTCKDNSDDPTTGEILGVCEYSVGGWDGQQAKNCGGSVGGADGGIDPNRIVWGPVQKYNDTDSKCEEKAKNGFFGNQTFDGTSATITNGGYQFYQSYNINPGEGQSDGGRNCFSYIQEQFPEKVNGVSIRQVDFTCPECPEDRTKSPYMWNGTRGFCPGDEIDVNLEPDPSYDPTKEPKCSEGVNHYSHLGVDGFRKMGITSYGNKECSPDWSKYPWQTLSDKYDQNCLNEVADMVYNDVGANAMGQAFRGGTGANPSGKPGSTLTDGLYGYCEDCKIGTRGTGGGGPDGREGQCMSVWDEKDDNGKGAWEYLYVPSISVAGTVEYHNIAAEGKAPWHGWNICRDSQGKGHVKGSEFCNL